MNFLHFSSFYIFIFYFYIISSVIELSWSKIDPLPV